MYGHKATNAQTIGISNNGTEHTKCIVILYPTQQTHDESKDTALTQELKTQIPLKCKESLNHVDMLPTHHSKKYHVIKLLLLLFFLNLHLHMEV